MFMNFAVSLKLVWYKDLKGCILFQSKVLKIALTLCMTSVKGSTVTWKLEAKTYLSKKFYLLCPNSILGGGIWIKCT